MKEFKFLDHTADIKFQAVGKSLEEVFVNCAKALFTSIYEGKVKEKSKRTFKVDGSDNEALLYNFLEEFLILIDAENFLPSKIKIKIKNKKLSAEVFGDSSEKYSLNIHVKAITYNEMFIKKEDGHFVAQVVLDI